MASQEYNRRVDVLICTVESSLTATELAEVREHVAQEEPWEALFSLAWIIERRAVSIPVETKRSIAHLAEAWIEREQWPESFRVFLPVCKGCGERIITGILREVDETTVEYCQFCDPNRPRVKSSDLDRMVCVPPAYHKLVELELVFHVIISPCEDAEFLVGDNLFTWGKDLDVINRNSHLQPFARTGCGDTWCCTAFRTGPSREPEILLIEDSMERIVVYAPNFQTFLYRNALEDTSAFIPDPDKMLPGILDRAKLLRKLGEDVLADDLESVVREPVKDCTPDYLEPRGVKYLARLAEEDVDARVERFLGRAFLKQEHSYDFLQSA